MVHLRDRVGLFARIMNVFARLNFQWPTRGSYLPHRLRTGHIHRIILASADVAYRDITQLRTCAAGETLETEARLKRHRRWQNRRQQRHFHHAGDRDHA